MEFITILEFGARTKDWLDIEIDINPFMNIEYSCVCGNSQVIKNIEDGLIRQLSENRFVLRNRECKAVTCFQISKSEELLPLYSAVLT